MPVKRISVVGIKEKRRYSSDIVLIFFLDVILLLTFDMDFEAC